MYEGGAGNSPAPILQFNVAQPFYLTVFRISDYVIMLTGDSGALTLE
jgi:hypothetical protein